MKTKRLMRSSLKVAMTAFLVFFTGNAFAIDNKTHIVSPYWQVDSGSYSFIAVSHSSLSGMNSQIGIKVTALDHSTDKEYGTAQSFTINAGATQRIFIVPTSHTTLNPTSITDSDVTFIRGTNNYSYGSIRVEPSANPVTYKYIMRDPSNPGDQGIANGQGEGFRDATMLTYWGSVVVEANTTGFAMEFIGDMNDSTSSTTINKTCNDVKLKSATAQRVCVSSGVNLQ